MASPLDLIDNDTKLVGAITVGASGLIVTVTGLALLANNWNAMANADVIQQTYHAEHPEAHGAEHPGAEHPAPAGEAAPSGEATH